MTNIILKTFQEKAISDLRKQFLELWKTTNRKLPLVFKAPTGSGKTVMVAQFLKDMSSDPQFDVDKSYLWFSFSEESYEQSKNKLFDYYGGANEVNLLDLNDLSKGKLEKNNVFFINWQKIKSSTKEGRKLRNPTEYTYGDDGIFYEFLKNSKNCFLKSEIAFSWNVFKMMLFIVAPLVFEQLHQYLTLLFQHI